jgi:HEPN domain-containing protein
MEYVKIPHKVLNAVFDWQHGITAMPQWAQADLMMLDKKYAEAGIHPHQRPMRAAVELLGADFSLGMFSHPEVAAITQAYRELFPAVEQTWPGAGIGLAASVDQVRRVKLGVAFGHRALLIWQLLGFESEATWLGWCRRDAGIAAETALAFADLHDFANGVDFLGPENAEAGKLWHMAESNLSDVANVLPVTFSVDSVLQPICLTAELSLKAALTHLGKNPWGHKLSTLAKDLVDLRPHRDDAEIYAVIGKFPDYVESRYKPEGLSRYQVVRLALAAQFVAASSVRRLSPVDMALAMESDTWPGPRGPFLPSTP